MRVAVGGPSDCLRPPARSPAPASLCREQTLSGRVVGCPGQLALERVSGLGMPRRSSSRYGRRACLASRCEGRACCPVPPAARSRRRPPPASRPCRSVVGPARVPKPLTTPRAAPDRGMRAVPRRTRRAFRPRVSACGRRPLCRSTFRSAEAVVTSLVSVDAAAARRGFPFIPDGPHGATRSRPRHVPSVRSAPGSPRPRWCLGHCVSCVSSGARAALCRATWSRRRSPHLWTRGLATAIRCRALRSLGISRRCHGRSDSGRRGRSPEPREC